MDFIPLQNRSLHTITAIASAIGEGGVAVIRLSGQDAIHIANKLLSINLIEIKSHVVKYAVVVDQHNQVVDEVLFFIMRSPKSFTGEDVVEIHCHGGVIIPNKILTLLLYHGATLALPGEFTQRAFLNGKIDLSQAEAIQEMIHAKNEIGYKLAKQQLLGKLSERIRYFQEEITDITAIIEAWVDYPEEGLEFASEEEMNQRLLTIFHQMKQLLETFHDGKRLSEGLELCIMGIPNVGKSSLLNALLRKDRAIVTPIPGTTRDLIEEELIIDQLSFRITDTAGIRETEEIIEQEGIRRSHQKALESDIILFLLDATKQVSREELDLIHALPKHKRIIIWNKIDQSTPCDMGLFLDSLCISAKETIGIEALKQTIKAKALESQQLNDAELLLTKQRHFHALQESLSHLNKCIEGFQLQISPEFLSIDLRECLKSLGHIIGRNITEDILDSIFSKFCVGK
ncbi:MAG: tRNA uridine-5-carboxymethylaminomethyl(34) synthesis GTPase MnmE [Chlamydiales bacterium]|nr:tRNA uridine-5-carboxymethylaminomethyl(34) synthesis GTPase MnmE [Chlamydiales bacterium]